MKKSVLAIISFGVITAAPFAAAQYCPNPADYPVRFKTHSVGAINQETFKVLDALLQSNTLADLRQSDSPELAKLYSAHLIQDIQGGRVVCAEARPGFFDYAKRVHLKPEGFSVWVREKDIAKFD